MYKVDRLRFLFKKAKNDPTARIITGQDLIQLFQLSNLSYTSFITTNNIIFAPIPDETLKLNVKSSICESIARESIRIGWFCMFASIQNLNLQSCALSSLIPVHHLFNKSNRLVPSDLNLLIRGSQSEVGTLLCAINEIDKYWNYQFKNVNNVEITQEPPVVEDRYLPGLLHDGRILLSQINDELKVKGVSINALVDASVEMHVNILNFDGAFTYLNVKSHAISHCDISVNQLNISNFNKQQVKNLMLLLDDHSDSLLEVQAKITLCTPATAIVPILEKSLPNLIEFNITISPDFDQITVGVQKFKQIFEIIHSNRNIIIRNGLHQIIVDCTVVSHHHNAAHHNNGKFWYINLFDGFERFNNESVIMPYFLNNDWNIVQNDLNVYLRNLKGYMSHTQQNEHHLTCTFEFV